MPPLLLGHSPPWRICFSGFNLRLLDPCLLSRADGGHPGVRPDPPSSIIRWISIAWSPRPGHGVHGTPLVPTYPNAPSTTTQEPTRDNDDPEHHPSFSQHHPTFEAPPGASVYARQGKGQGLSWARDKFCMTGVERRGPGEENVSRVSTCNGRSVTLRH